MKEKRSEGDHQPVEVIDEKPESDVGAEVLKMQGDEKEALEKALPERKNSRLSKISLALFCLTGIAVAASQFIQDYQREKFDEGGVPSLQEKNEAGEDLTRDEILEALHSGEKPFLAAEILQEPRKLNGKTWQKEAIFQAALLLDIESLQYSDSFFTYLDEAQITKIFSECFYNDPLYLLKNYENLKQKYPVVEKFLPQAIKSIVGSSDAKEILNYVTLLRTLPDGNQIILERLSKLPPESVVGLGNKIKGEAQAESVFALSVKYLQINDPVKLIASFSSYDKCAEADNILKTAIHILASTHPEIMFEHFDVLKDRPWIMETLRTVLDDQAAVLVDKAHFYRELPGGEELFLRAYEKVKRCVLGLEGKDGSLPQPERGLYFVDYEHLIKGFANYQNLPGAEQLVEKAFVAVMDNYNKNFFCHILPNFLAKPWAKKLLDKIIEKNPDTLLDEFDSYKNLPNAEEIFNKIIEQYKKNEYVKWPIDWSMFFAYPAGVDFLVEKEAVIGYFDWFYRYESLQKYPQGREILERCLKKANKLEADGLLYNFLWEHADFLATPWVRAWFLKNIDQLSFDLLSLLFKSDEDWKDNLEIIKKAVSRGSSPDFVLSHAERLYSADKVWATTVLLDFFKVADDKVKASHIYTLIRLSEPSINKVLLEFVKGLPPQMVLLHWREFMLLDKEWATQAVKEQASSLTTKDLLKNARVLFAVDADYAKRVIEEKLAKNYALGLDFYNEYRYNLDNAKEILLRSARVALQINPGLLVKSGRDLQDVPGGKEILLSALDKVIDSDPQLVFKHFEHWNDLPLENLRPFLRRAAINDPEQALRFLSSNSQVSNLMRSVLATDTDPLIVKLLAWDDKPYDSHTSMVGAVLLFNYPDKPFEEIKETVENEKRLFLSLVEVLSVENSTARATADRELSGLALRQVREVNDLHERPDQERFKLTEDLSATELYTLMVYGEQEEFTSTYNGFFNRLLEKMKSEKLNPGALLERAGYNKFRAFIKLATGFNRLEEFLSLMDSAGQQDLLGKFVKDVEKNPEFLAEAVAVADTFSAVEDSGVLKILQQAVRQEYERVLSLGHREGIAVYGLLAGMFGEKAVIDEEWISTMAEKYHLPGIKNLPIKTLDRDGKIVQRYFFYDDKDGRASFQSFLGGYRGDPKWQVRDFEGYVKIVSVDTAKKVEIFANKPETGNWAVDDLLKKEKKQPTVLVHRGHSYHAVQTIPFVDEHVRLVSLGSCGGYSLIEPVIERTKDANIISTKGTGTMEVNDPLLKMLNQEMAAGRDINWSEFWAKAEQRLGGNKHFKDYVAPNRNLGVLFLKAYREHVENDTYYDGNTNK